MKTPALSAVLGTVLLAGAFSCAPPPQEEGSAADQIRDYEADVVALTDLVSAWDAAMNASDVEGLLAIYTEDGAAMPPNAPAVYGKEALRGFFEEFFAQGRVEVEDRAEQIVVDGDLAVSFGTYTLTITPEEGAAMTDSGKWMAASQRQPDGSWLTLRNAWSSDLPLPEM